MFSGMFHWFSKLKWSLSKSLPELLLSVQITWTAVICTDVLNCCYLYRLPKSVRNLSSTFRSKVSMVPSSFIIFVSMLFWFLGRPLLILFKVEEGIWVELMDISLLIQSYKTGKTKIFTWSRLKKVQTIPMHKQFCLVNGRFAYVVSENYIIRGITKIKLKLTALKRSYP